jgi:hypothetical protein
VAIAFQKYPDSWPCEQERPFVEWSTTQAEKVLLEDVNSFAVCDFLELFFRMHRHNILIQRPLKNPLLPFL